MKIPVPLDYRVFRTAEEIHPRAPRCPHRNDQLQQCVKVADHHLADYPGSDQCAALSQASTGPVWLFWKVDRTWLIGAGPLPMDRVDMAWLR